jgi:hypothetical protein
MSSATTAAEHDAMVEAELEAIESGRQPAPAAETAPTAPAGTTATPDAQAPIVADAVPNHHQADDLLDPNLLQEIASGSQPATPAVQTLQFKGEQPADYDTQKKALWAEKAEALQKMMDGEIDARTYAQTDARISGQLEDLTVQRTTAVTLEHANAQVQAQTMQAVNEALIQQAKASGELDYLSDAGAVDQFNASLAVLVAHPDNAQKPYAELAPLAHKMVLLARGVVNPQTPVNTQKPAPVRQVPSIPTTLSGLPNAGAANTQTVDSVLANLTGKEFEAAFDALPASKQAEYLRQQK